MQLRGRTSVMPGGQDSPGWIVVAREEPGWAESGATRSGETAARNRAENA
jgi:hypothetical protein